MVEHFLEGGGQRNKQKTKGKKREVKEGKPAYNLHGQPESMLRETMAEKTRIQWCDFTPKLMKRVKCTCIYASR
jgi:hypothetical protein